MSSQSNTLGENQSDDGSHALALAQLSNLVIPVAKQDQIAWTVYGLYWSANALLLVALFTTGDLPGRIVGLIVSAVGVILSMVWALIQARAIAHLAFYEATIDGIEEHYLHVPRDIAISGRLNADRYAANLAGTWRVRPLVRASPVVAATLWALALIWFASRCGAA